mgnify:CR=1 FL=1
MAGNSVAAPSSDFSDMAAEAFAHPRSAALQRGFEFRQTAHTSQSGKAFGKPGARRRRIETGPVRTSHQLQQSEIEIQRRREKFRILARQRTAIRQGRQRSAWRTIGNASDASSVVRTTA